MSRVWSGIHRRRCCRRFSLCLCRLGITGAWGLARAEAALRLRALGSSDDFDAYWAWHEQQKFARNDQARYRSTLILAS